jgi:hypothetical protein
VQCQHVTHFTLLGVSSCFYNHVHNTVAQIDYLHHHTEPSNHVEHRSSHLTDFHEISYLEFLLKFVGTFWLWLKQDKNNRCLAWRLMHIHVICLYNEKQTVFCEVQNNAWKKNLIWTSHLWAQYRKWNMPPLMRYGRASEARETCDYLNISSHTRNKRDQLQCLHCIESIHEQ